MSKVSMTNSTTASLLPSQAQRKLPGASSAFRSPISMSPNISQQQEQQQQQQQSQQGGRTSSPLLCKITERRKSHNNNCRNPNASADFLSRSHGQKITNSTRFLEHQYQQGDNNAMHKEEKLQVHSSPLLLMNHNNSKSNEQERRSSEEMIMSFQTGSNNKSFTEGNFDTHSSTNSLTSEDMGGASFSSDCSLAPIEGRHNDLQLRSETSNTNAPRTSASQCLLRRDESIGIDRIDARFAALDIPYGRLLEVQQLHTTLEQIQNHTLPLSFILLSGYAGTGKSTIVTKFQQNLKQKKLKKDNQTYTAKKNKSKSTNSSNAPQGEEGIQNHYYYSYFFVSGKFSLKQKAHHDEEEATTQHQHQHQQPYTAVASAFTELCSNIQALKDSSCPTEKSEFYQLQKDIQDAVGSTENCNMLLDIMPNLQDLLFVLTSSQEQHEGEEEKNSPFKKKDLEQKDQTQQTLERDTASFMEEQDDKLHNKTVATTTTTATTTGIEHTQNAQHQKPRFAYVFRSFVRAICKPSRPLILYLDDLQWADTASLELLKTMVTDPDVKGLLVIGCYRHNEVHHPFKTYDESQNTSSNDNNEPGQEQQHPLAKLIQIIEEKASSTDNQQRSEQDSDKAKRIPIVQRITVDNLDKATLHQILSDVVDHPKSSATQDFCDVLYSKTYGNIFFSIQFLHMLQKENLLQYNSGTFQWTWDIEKIRKKSSFVSDNVVDLLRNKLQNLHSPNPNQNQSTAKSLLKVLQILSCLGSEFDKSTLACVAKSVLLSLEDQKIDKFPSSPRSLSKPLEKLTLSITHEDISDPTTASLSEQQEDRKVLQLPMSTSSTNTIISIEGYLDIGFREGLLIDCGRTCRFAHDQIQSVAYSLIPDQDRERLYVEIGYALVRSSSNNATTTMDENDDDDHTRSIEATTTGTTPKVEDKMLFVIVDSLNSGSALIVDEDERCWLSKLNLRASRKAMESCAFVSAAVYASIGIKLLGSNHWVEEPSLSIGLYNAAILAESCGSNHDKLHYYIGEVLKEDESRQRKEGDGKDCRTIPFEETLVAYSALVDSLSCRSQLKEAIDVSLEVLSELGISLSTRFGKVSVISQIIKTQCLLDKFNKSMKGQELASLPLMKDATKIKAMRFMNMIIHDAYEFDKKLFAVTICEMVQWSIKYGVCSHSAVAFTSYGVLMLTTFEDFGKGRDLATSALMLNERLSDGYNQSAVHSIAWGFLRPWTHLFSSCRKHLLSAYHVGLSVGDQKHATNNIYVYILMGWYAGEPLKKLEAECRTYIQQMKELNHTRIMERTLITYQAILNLMGRSDDPGALKGDVINHEEVLHHYKINQRENMENHTRSMQLMLAYYFGDYHLASAIIEETNQSFKKKNLAAGPNIRYALFEGLTAFAVIRHGNSKNNVCDTSKTKMPKTSAFAVKWRRNANNTVRKVAKWVKKGCPNAVHILYLLEAEQLNVVHGKTRDAKQKYNLAISTAARHGFRQDRAMANELAGEMLLAEGNVQRAGDYLKSAHDLYLEWDAYAKADQLHKKYPDLIPL